MTQSLRSTPFIFLCCFLFFGSLYGNSPETATDDEVNMIKKTLNRLFPGNFEIKTLNSTESGGDKVFSGQVSFFGTSAVQLECTTLGSEKKLRSVKADFPASAKFDLGMIQRVCGSDLRKIVPNTISSEAGVSIKGFQVSLKSDGYTVDKFTTELLSSQWDFMQLGNFKMSNMKLNIEYTASAAQKITGSIYGELMIKQAKLLVTTNLPENKKEWVIKTNYDGSSGNLTVNDVLTAFGGTDLVNNIFSVVQGSSFFTNMSIPQFELALTPFKKELSLETESSIGKLAMIVSARSSRPSGFLVVKPAQDFKFAKVHNSLGWLDIMSIKLNEAELIVGNQPMQFGATKVAPGLAIRSKIDLPQEIEDLLKSKQTKLYLWGHIADLSTFELKANLDLNADLGSGVKMEQVGIGLRSRPAEKLFFVDGKIVFPVDNTKLRFKMEGGGDAASSTFQVGLDLESINGDNNASEWREPFGIPYLGIRNLGGTVGLNPATIIGRLGLRGDIRLGQIPKAGDPDRRILGKINLDLDVPKPMNSSIQGELKNTTFIKLIQAFKSDFNLGGALEKALNSGIENLALDVRPSQGFFKVGGDGKILGQSGHLDIEASKSGSFAAKGWIEPIRVSVGSLNLIEIAGSSGGRPTFNIALSEEPTFTINGGIKVLGIGKSGSLSLSTKGFRLQAQGEMLNHLKMKADISGLDIKDPGSMHVVLEMEQDILKMIKEEITNFIKKISEKVTEEINKAKRELEQARKNANAIEKVFIDIGDAFLSAVDEIQGAVAVAGMFVVKGMLGTIDIKGVRFEGSAAQLAGKIDLSIQLVVAGKNINLNANVDLKSLSPLDLAKAIAEQTGDIILDAFSGLEAEFGEMKGSLHEFAEGVEPNHIDAIKKSTNLFYQGAVMAKKFETAFKEFWDGPSYDLANKGKPMSTIAPGIRHYEVTFNKIVITNADDGLKGFSRDKEIEIYGAVMVNPASNLQIAKGANTVAWSSNRGQSVKCRAGSVIGTKHTKHFYAPAQESAMIEIISKIWEDDGGMKSLADNKFPGRSSIIDLKSYSTPKSTYITCVADEDDPKSVLQIHYTVYAHPMITSSQLLGAIRGGNINQLEELIKKGGDINAIKGQALTEAVNSNQAKMVAYLLANGHKPNSAHLQTAINKNNTELITRLMVRGAAPNAAMLDATIKKRNHVIAAMIMDKGQKPNLEQYKWSISQKDYKMASLIMDYGVKPTAAELKTAVDNQDIKAARYALTAGHKADQLMLHQAIKAKNTNLFDLLATTVIPDDNTVYEAGKTNDLETVKMVLTKIEKSAPNSLLNTAVENNNKEIAKLAIDYGSDPSSGANHAALRKNKDMLVFCLQNGGTANHACMTYAATANDKQLVQDMLYDYGGNPDDLLSHANQNNKVEYAKIALNEGADPDPKIEYAAKQKYVDLVNLYIDYGADPNPAMKHVISQQDAPLLKRLVDAGGDVSVAAHLANAASLKNLEMVKTLVEAGADPNHGMKNAVAADQFKMVQYLLQMGASPKGHISVPACAGKTATVKLLLEYGGDANEGIKCATDSGNKEMTLDLLKFGANPNGHMASPARKGYLQVVQYLVNYGADPNEGLPASVETSKVNVAKFLLETGAVPKGLVYTASKNLNLEMVKLLCLHGDAPQPGMQPAADNGNVAIAKVLVAYGADVTPFSYIHSAVDNGFVEMTTYLIEQGSDPNRKDEKGDYLLHMELRDNRKNYDPEMVKVLVNGKADVNVRNRKGLTPLHYAAKKGNKNLEIVKFLVEAGADVTATNDKGKKPVYRFARGKEVKAYLESKGAKDFK